ncbi:MAG: response regulator [Candidatus Omnitrophota bacterium]
MAQRILIVDDEAELREILSTALVRAGYEFETAAGGREAVGAYLESLDEDNPYSAIILDIMMPKGDGLQTIEAIRKEEQRRGIQLGHGVYIVMLTALKNPWVEAFNKGCDDYLLKPYKINELLEKLEKKLNKN